MMDMMRSRLAIFHTGVLQGNAGEEALLIEQGDY
jgi:hypothetical protein